LNTLYFLLSDPPTPEPYPLSLHDALPIYRRRHRGDPSVVAGIAGARDGRQRQETRRRIAQTQGLRRAAGAAGTGTRGHGAVGGRSEEHTSELQSRENLVCRLLLEKKKKNK